MGLKSVQEKLHCHHLCANSLRVKASELMMGEGNVRVQLRVLMVVIGMMMMVVGRVTSQNYEDALTKSILFFEGQRSGRLPPSQRMTWRKDSALNDGTESNVSVYMSYECSIQL